MTATITNIYPFKSVTTTTTTTTTYAPITLPPLPSPPSPKDPKLYPLLHAPVPHSLRQFPLVFPGGARAMFSDGGTTEEEVEPEWVGDDVASGNGWRWVKNGNGKGKEKEVTLGLSDAIDRYGRKRMHSDSEHPSAADENIPMVGDVLMEGIEESTRSPPPRKKARASDQPSTRSHAAPPSPMPSPQPSPSAPVLWAPNTTSVQPQAPLQPDLSLTTLLTLPNLLTHFVSLPPALQSHFLLTLLRHSPLPVLRTLHSILTPTLARDFLVLLPPEISSLILAFLPPSALFSASRVSRSWRALVDSDPSLWRSLLKRSGTWFGGASEAVFTERVYAHRARHPQSITPNGLANPLPLPHPYKLLFKSRHTVLNRWTNTTPKRLHFAAHGSSVVTCLLFFRGRIISASDDHSIHLYDPARGEQMRKLEGHEGGVWALATCSRLIPSTNPAAPPRYHDTLVSGSTDRTVRIWNLDTGRNTHVFGGHTSTVRCLAVVRPTWIDRDDGSGIQEKWPKRTVIVTGSRDHTLRVWRLPAKGDDEYRCFGADGNEGDPAEVCVMRRGLTSYSC